MVLSVRDSNCAQNTNSKVTVETLPMLGSGNTDPWKDYSFV
jgi:hypothetical protein